MRDPAQTEFVLNTVQGLLEEGWSKELAKYRNQVWCPHGEWQLVHNKKQPDQDYYVFQDAEAWSVVGAVLRAEFFMPSGRHVPENGAVSKDKPGWVADLLKTDAVKYLQMAASELGYNYLADFNDDRKTDQARALKLVARAQELFYNN